MLGFLKSWRQMRKTKAQLEKMRLKAELMKQKNALFQQKTRKTSTTVKTFAKLQQDLADIQELMPQDKNEFIAFMETDTGKKIVDGLFSFLGGLVGDTKNETQNNLVQVFNKLTPEQKTKGLALFEQFMKGI